MKEVTVRAYFDRDVSRNYFIDSGPRTVSLVAYFLPLSIRSDVVKEVRVFCLSH